MSAVPGQPPAAAVPPAEGGGDTPPAEQSPAEQRQAEGAVERTAERVETAAAAPIREAEAAVQSGAAAQADAVETLQEKLDKIVTQEAERLSRDTPLTIEQAREVASGSVGHVMDRMHAAHGGANPSPPVAAAVQGAVQGAASQTAGAAVEGELAPTEGVTPDGGGDATPEASADPPPPPDDPPAGTHWAQRGFKVPGLGR